MTSSKDDISSNEKKLPRWQFRKKQKIEKRRTKRQSKAQAQASSAESQQPKVNHLEETIEKQKYEESKRVWEEKEKRFRLIELVKKAAREKEIEAKKSAEKRWKDTLLNLPAIPPTFVLPTADDSEKKKPAPLFRTFIESSDAQINPTTKRTYRERYLERKKLKTDKKKSLETKKER